MDSESTINNDMEVLLHRVYSDCAPEKLSEISEIMRQFHGDPDELIYELQDKYSIHIGVDGSITPLKVKTNSHHKRHSHQRHTRSRRKSSSSMKTKVSAMSQGDDESATSQRTTGSARPNIPPRPNQILETPIDPRPNHMPKTARSPVESVTSSDGSTSLESPKLSHSFPEDEKIRSRRGRERRARDKPKSRRSKESREFSERDKESDKLHTMDSDNPREIHSVSRRSRESRGHLKPKSKRSLEARVFAADAGVEDEVNVSESNSWDLESVTSFKSDLSVVRPLVPPRPSMIPEDFPYHSPKQAAVPLVAPVRSVHLRAPLRTAAVDTSTEQRWGRRMREVMAQVQTQAHGVKNGTEVPNKRATNMVDISSMIGESIASPIRASELNRASSLNEASALNRASTSPVIRVESKPRAMKSEESSHDNNSDRESIASSSSSSSSSVALHTRVVSVSATVSAARAGDASWALRQQQQQQKKDDMSNNRKMVDELLKARVTNTGADIRGIRGPGVMQRLQAQQQRQEHENIFGRSFGHVQNDSDHQDDARVSEMGQTSAKRIVDVNNDDSDELSTDSANTSQSSIRRDALIRDINSVFHSNINSKSNNYSNNNKTSNNSNIGNNKNINNDNHNDESNNNNKTSNNSSNNSNYNSIANTNTDNKHNNSRNGSSSSSNNSVSSARSFISKHSQSKSTKEHDRAIVTSASDSMTPRSPSGDKFKRHHRRTRTSDAMSVSSAHSTTNSSKHKTNRTRKVKAHDIKHEDISTHQTQHKLSPKPVKKPKSDRKNTKEKSKLRSSPRHSIVSSNSSIFSSTSSKVSTTSSRRRRRSGSKQGNMSNGICFLCWLLPLCVLLCAWTVSESMARRTFYESSFTEIKKHEPPAEPEWRPVGNRQVSPVKDDSGTTLATDGKTPSLAYVTTPINLVGKLKNKASRALHLRVQPVATVFPVRNTAHVRHGSPARDGTVWTAGAPVFNVSWSKEITSILADAPTIDDRGNLYISPIHSSNGYDVNDEDSFWYTRHPTAFAIVSLHPETGERRWALPGISKSLSSPLILDADAYGMQHIFQHMSRDRVVALDTGGNLLWELKLNDNWIPRRNSPNKNNPKSYHIPKYDPDSEALEGEHTWGLNYFAPIDAVVGATSDGVLFVLSRTTGETLAAPRQLRCDGFYSDGNGPSSSPSSSYYLLRNERRAAVSAWYALRYSSTVEPQGLDGQLGDRTSFDETVLTDVQLLLDGHPELRSCVHGPVTISNNFVNLDGIENQDLIDPVVAPPLSRVSDPVVTSRFTDPSTNASSRSTGSETALFNSSRSTDSETAFLNSAHSNDAVTATTAPKTVVSNGMIYVASSWPEEMGDGGTIYQAILIPADAGSHFKFRLRIVRSVQLDGALIGSSTVALNAIGTVAYVVLQCQSVLCRSQSVLQALDAHTLKKLWSLDLAYYYDEVIQGAPSIATHYYDEVFVCTNKALVKVEQGRVQWRVDLTDILVHANTDEVFCSPRSTPTVTSASVVISVSSVRTLKDVQVVLKTAIVVLDRVSGIVRSATDTNEEVIGPVAVAPDGSYAVSQMPQGRVLTRSVFDQRRMAPLVAGVAKFRSTRRDLHLRDVWCMIRHISRGGSRALGAFWVGADAHASADADFMQLRILHSEAVAAFRERSSIDATIPSHGTKRRKEKPDGDTQTETVEGEGEKQRVEEEVEKSISSSGKLDSAQEEAVRLATERVKHELWYVRYDTPVVDVTLGGLRRVEYVSARVCKMLGGY